LSTISGDVPNENEVFYLQHRSKWRYVLEGNNYYEEYSYPKSKLVESGKYKYKWHDCYDGNIVLELISVGRDYYYEVNKGAVHSSDACNDKRINKYPKSDLKKGWIIYKEYKFYKPC